MRSGEAMRTLPTGECTCLHADHQVRLDSAQGRRHALGKRRADAQYARPVGCGYARMHSKCPWNVIEKANSVEEGWRHVDSFGDCS